MLQNPQATQVRRITEPPPTHELFSLYPGEPLPQPARLSPRGVSPLTLYPGAPLPLGVGLTPSTREAYSPWGWAFSRRG